VKQATGFYPRVHVDTTGCAAVGQAGGVLLTETVRAAGLDQAMSAGLARWRKPIAVHDPAKIVLDLALSLAVGGDCLADVAVLRSEPGLYGLVASDPTVSRTVDALAADVSAVLAAIEVARAGARARVWALADRTHPTTTPALLPRWSLTSTPPWSGRTARRSTRRPRSSGGSGVASRRYTVREGGAVLP